MAVMEIERIRMIFDTDERHRRAVRIYAAKHGVGVSEALNDAIESFMEHELREAEQQLSRDDKKRKKTDD